MDMLIVRGKRVLQWLGEATYRDLERQTLQFVPPTKFRQYATAPIHIVKMELVPARDSGNLEVRGTANSTTSGNHYTPVLLFSNVIYDDADQNDNITFKGSDNQEYHIEPISLARNNLKVGCNCLDFRWRFSVWNARDDALHGNPPGPYQKRTNRPPVNPRRVSGLCKHLIKTVASLQDSGMVID